MTEHVHYWCDPHIFPSREQNYWVCHYEGCDERLTFKEAEARLNEYEPLKEAFTIAIHLLGHADFKNGNTDPGGTIDEGEVHACRLMDEIIALVPQLYANILEGKDD